MAPTSNRFRFSSAPICDDSVPALAPSPSSQITKPPVPRRAPGYPMPTLAFSFGFLPSAPSFPRHSAAPSASYGLGHGAPSALALALSLGTELPSALGCPHGLIRPQPWLPPQPRLLHSASARSSPRHSTAPTASYGLGHGFPLSLGSCTRPRHRAPLGTRLPPRPHMASAILASATATPSALALALGLGIELSSALGCPLGLVRPWPRLFHSASAPAEVPWKLGLDFFPSAMYSLGLSTQHHARELCWGAPSTR